LIVYIPYAKSTRQPLELIFRPQRSQVLARGHTLISSADNGSILYPLEFSKVVVMGYEN